MQCQDCRSENPLGARFCMQCGNRLPLPCPRCGMPNAPRTRFCASCGVALEPAQEGRATDTADGERRQLSVMFCDLVSSTALAERLGAETYRELVHAYQSVAGPTVERFGGYVAQYLGDGLLVYFGYPRASEDDAERAVQAGLAVLDALREARAQLLERLGVSLDVRLALHTGYVVIGEVGAGARREMLALGEHANLAARLQERAPINALLISEATLRLVHGLFVTRSLGEAQLRGLSRPVQIYQVLQRSDLRSRGPLHAERLTPLIGRGQELNLLLDRWELAQAGQGQVLLLSGEAGIGKSRLVSALHAALANVPHTWLEYRCEAAAQHSALHPVVDALRRELAARGCETDIERLDGLEQNLRGLDFPVREALPLVADLLALPLPPEAGPVVDLAADRRKARTLDLLSTATLRMCADQPVLLHVEDLHWVDPSTLELLDKLVAGASDVPLMLVMTHRPDFQRPSWEALRHVFTLRLNRLTRAQSLSVIEHVLAAGPSSSDLVLEIVQRTDGVPLFLEELTRALLEAGAFRAAPGSGPHLREIPSTLADSLMARLDRLGPAKQLAQLCSVLGRTFPRRLLEAVWEGTREELERGLERLLASDLLQLEGADARGEYSFRHALIQEAAYESLLRSRRAALHGRVAAHLERELPEVAAAQPERLAHHLCEAGAFAASIDAWERAGVKATERSAAQEAIQHLGRGLALIERLPQGPERIERELRLQIALGVPLQAVRGYTSPEVEAALARARELCEQVGDTSQLFPVVAGLSALYLVRGRVFLGRSLAEQAFRLAERSDEVMLRVWAHYSLSITHLYLGHFEEARCFAEAGIALAGGREPGSLGARYAGDPAIDCHVVAAQALWILGRTRDARAVQQAGLALARRLGQPLCLAYVTLQGSILHQMARDPAAAGALADETLALAQAGSFELFDALARCVGGWACAVQGMPQAGIDAIERAFAVFRKSGAELIPIPVSAFLAEAYIEAGLLADAWTLLGEALHAAEESGARISEVEMRRLLARCRRRASPSDLKGVERLLREALNAAEKQAAASLALRVSIDLAEILELTDRRSEGQHLVATALAHVQPDASADLDAARALLGV